MKRFLPLLGLFFLSAGFLFPCSVFNYTRSDGKTFVGRNLDWIPSSYGWIQFIQPTEGKYGVVLFGAEEHIWPQGGMNDQGLVLGMTATPFHDIPSDPAKLTMQLDFWEKLFTTCATVPEVLAFLDTYDLSSRPNYFEQGQMLWTDRWGNSAVHEGDVVSPRQGYYQMITNFCYTRPWLGGYPCGRYNLIDYVLSASQDYSEEELMMLVEMVHGTAWGGYTVWSVFYDPETLDITLFYRGDFTRPLHMNLKEELGKGVKKYYMDDLFSGCVGDWEGDTMPDARPLPGCGTSEAALECDGDVDVYTFQPSILGEYTFETTGSTDTRLEILDSSGTILQSDQNGGQQGNARIQIQLEGGTTYGVRVGGEGYPSTGEYGLFLSGCTGRRNCGIDPANDDHPFALPIRQTGIWHAAVDCTGDIDYYVFQVPESGTYDIYTEGTTDTVLQVEDGLYQILTRDDDGGEGKNASVRIDLTAGDTIWIRIGAYGNHGTGDYDFIIADGKTRTTWNWIVPAAARISGAAGTRWVTDLVIRNQGSTPADAMMEYWPQEGIQPTPIPISIQPGAVMKIDNVIEDRFQLLESAGAIRVSSNQPILVSSRTYNLLEEGTYGQAIPGQREEDALLEGERGYLIGLAESDTHRTNLGFVNPLSSDSTVRITMYDTTGNPIGSSRSWTLSGHSFVQIDHVLEQFGTPPIEEARAEVEILSGAVFSYISIVDQKTGDPVYRPVQRALGATRGLPGVSRAPGEAGTLWRTELWILSTSSYEQEAILKFLPRQGESGYEDLPLIIQPGAMIHVNDALNEISHIAEGSGTYVLETGPEVLVTGRTYTEKEIGTYGQGLVSLRPDLAISGENAGYLIMGEETEKSRSNLGLINPGQDPVDITLQGISPDGTTLLSHQWTIEGESSVQVDHILTLFSQNDLGSATIRISISDPDRGGSIWAWLSVVDQVTGDAVFEEAVVESMGPPPQNRTLLSPVSKRPHQPRILGTLP